MSKNHLFVVTVLTLLTSKAQSQQRISQYFEWTESQITYQSSGYEFKGQTLASMNYSLVTQCAMACLKDPRCLSYNFNNVNNLCHLNSGSHQSNPELLKPSDGWDYYLKDAYKISQDADPCLSTPCMNFGTCLSRSDKTYLCFCSSQWTGPVCNIKVDISWSGWSAWSDCSEKCGPGVAARSRTCVNKVDMSQKSVEMCYGMSHEIEECKVKDCPYWSEWSEWSQCSTAESCGEGHSSRIRQCVNSDPDQNCFGLAAENKTCSSVSCNAEVVLKPETGFPYGEGSLQIFENKQSDWLFVCADVIGGSSSSSSGDFAWTQQNGDVACKQMGFKHGAYSASKVLIDLANKDSEMYLLTNFKCSGDEMTLTSCRHSGWSVSSCNQKLTVKCVVDGRWSNWSEWSKCSVTCADGAQTRSRACSSPPPRNGGDGCEGRGQDTQPCSLPPCPVDAQWTQWTDWSGCTLTCGGGRQSRNRTCVPGRNNGKDCSGENFQNKTCNTLECPIDGFWSDWSQWGSCNITCGGGQQIRTRVCEDPKYGGQPCSGANITVQRCNSQSCAVDGYWLEWNQWSSCNATCGGGQRIRKRFCIEPQFGGLYCQGNNSEFDTCNTDPCPIDGTWKEWRDWSSCSITCGGGRQIRTRECNPPKYGGLDCPGDNTMEKFCNDEPCPVDGQWGEWTRWICSVTCGSGEAIRKRDCTAPANGGSSCKGLLEERDQCNMSVCPTPAEWSPWSAWSRCSATCGFGNRKRTRTCTQTLSGLNSLPCLNETASNDTKPCNQFACSSVQSCQDVAKLGLEESSFVSLSLNAAQPTKTTIVFCSLDGTTVSSIINSSYESDSMVTFKLNAPPPNYKVVYSSNEVQLSLDDVKTIVYNSKECKQQVSWKCKGYPMNIPSGGKLVYWKNKFSDEMSYWGDISTVVGTATSNTILCSCGEKSTCLPYKCSCDKNDTLNWGQDGGWLTSKLDLPLTEIVVLDSGYKLQEGKFRVGPLICN
ncbi:hypothetical protein HELRODRAFT_164684 [Helobdella robusta]|uniref:Apple domain-containing protein n=1 Tax=Helobdella robusta TaxID=6412 RepID=T1EVQ0_HELRO|nr:hypothetical protein HELRODRAFT_164684 [Helobdella robusta]ESN92609.1 hypothetical protein HELRODRAFT_164684 [Helobdella robusta]